MSKFEKLHFMKYKRTFQVVVICLACELYALLFAILIYSCGDECEYFKQ